MHEIREQSTKHRVYSRNTETYPMKDSLRETQVRVQKQVAPRPCVPRGRRAQAHPLRCRPRSEIGFLYHRCEAPKARAQSQVRLFRS
jgi:hypothetical protein